VLDRQLHHAIAVKCLSCVGDVFRELRLV